MRKLCIAVTAALILSAPVALGQAPTETPLPPASSVNLSLEQRHTIKEFVKDLHLPKVATNFPVTIGATVPRSVALQAMPPQLGSKVPQVKSHRLFVTGDRIVLVNPNDARIADVIDEA